MLWIPYPGFLLALNQPRWECFRPIVNPVGILNDVSLSFLLENATHQLIKFGGVIGRLDKALLSVSNG